MNLDLLNRVSGLAAKTAETRAEKDLRLWKEWKKMPNDMTLSALLTEFSGLINAEVNRWIGVLARPVLEAEAKKLAVLAFERYQPGKGAALSTVVANYLKKLSRLSYSHQSIARLPENKRLKYHSYEVAHAKLYDSLGRPPTTDELSDELGWSTNFLERFQTESARKELLESGPTPKGFEAEEHDSMVDFVYHDLPPQQKLIMEHLTGYRGSPILSNQEIMKKLKLSQGQLSYQKRLLEQAFLKATK